MYRSIFFGFFVALFCCFSAFSAPSFDVDISVDETALSVSEAKRQAMSKAMRQGLNEVVHNISTVSSVEKIEKLKDSQLQHFISGMMVLMEKTSDVRYIADLRVSINEKVLKAYMQENDMPIIISDSVDVLVIPLLEKENEDLLLWEDDNLWREAFLARGAIKKGYLNVFSIKNNLGNIAAIRADVAYDMSDKTYQDLAMFNRVENIFVVKYSLKDKKIYLKAFPDKKIDVIELDNQDFNAAVDLVVSQFKNIENRKKSDDSVVSNYEKMEIIYAYQSLKNWIELKKILDENPKIQDIKVVSMANKKVHFNIKFGGVIEKLQDSLELQGYHLKKEGEHYVIN